MKRAATAVIILSGALVCAPRTRAMQNQTPSGEASTTPATAQPKRPPQAKTQAEYQDYQAAIAKANDPAALETAANDFATKYPDSELRILLYKADMGSYRNANNAAKMMEMGRKVLSIDPDSPEGLLAVSEVLVERTHDTDLDKQERWDEATKLLQHCLQTIDTDIVAPPNTPQDKVDAYKAEMRSDALSFLGTLSFNQGKYPDAEGYYQKSLDAFPAQPDPVVVLRLALTLDKEGRYGDALKQADRAVELSQQIPAIAGPAKDEHDRLVQLTGGISSSDSTTPAKPQTPTAPAK